MRSRLFVAAILASGLSASVYAQNPNLRHLQQPGRQQQLPMQPIDIEGTVEGVMRGGIIVLDSKNQPWQVVVPPMAKVQVTGTATADGLQSGLLIEFKAELDDRGTIKEKVGELTIVSLSPERQPGLFPAEAIGEPDGVAEKAKAGKPTKRAAGAYRIVGKLTTGRGGKLAVQTGRGLLPLELTEQPTIALDVNDYSFAGKGAKISGKGMMMPNRPGMARAHELKIELAEPLTVVKKKGAGAKSESKRPAKRPKKDEGLPEPPADK